ncbi:hypothetical protein DER44DRAFT_682241 [Fusarium oxysporum]|nr:hypothetical protein DER44DRAFT_682241 [Fusarium oxysporum]
MPHDTILSLLTQPNFTVVNRANDGSNTTHSLWPDINSYTLWKDFNAANLYAMFEDIVESKWETKSSLGATQTGWDGEIFDEDELEHSVLSPHIFPPVNKAIEHALKYTKLDKKYKLDLNLGRAGRTYYEPGGDRRFKPDWALCCATRRSSSEHGDLRYQNLLPGDSKLSNKWQSPWHSHPDPSIQKAWSQPVRQILHYCKLSHCRYSFLITDLELVVFRVTPQATGEGLAPTRTLRQTARPGHSYHFSESTDASNLSDMMRDMSMESPSSYRPTSSATDGFAVEYQAVPMKNHGHGKRQLTVQLALFYLAWIAGAGNNTIFNRYPRFDSSWPRLDGMFLHSTMGLLSAKAKNLDYPYNQDERGPKWIDVNVDETGEPIHVLTLESVLTLDIAQRGGRYFYFYQDDEEEEVLITKEMPIYDRDGNVYGYFDGLVWNTGSPPDPSKKTKKQGKSSGRIHV